MVSLVRDGAEHWESFPWRWTFTLGAWNMSVYSFYQLPLVKGDGDASALGLLYSHKIASLSQCSIKTGICSQSSTCHWFKEYFDKGKCQRRMRCVGIYYDQSLFCVWNVSRLCQDVLKHKICELFPTWEIPHFLVSWMLPFCPAALGITLLVLTTFLLSCDMLRKQQLVCFKSGSLHSVMLEIIFYISRHLSMLECRYKSILFPFVNSLNELGGKVLKGQIQWKWIFVKYLSSIPHEQRC